MYLTRYNICLILKVWGKRTKKTITFSLSFDFMNKPPLELPELNKLLGGLIEPLRYVNVYRYVCECSRPSEEQILRYKHLFLSPPLVSLLKVSWHDKKF